MSLQNARTTTLHIATNNQKQDQGTLITHAGAPVERALTLHHDWALVTGPKTYYSILSPRHNMLPCNCQNVALMSMVILVLARSVSAIVF